MRRIDNFGEFAADHGLSGADAEPGADPDNDTFSTFEEWTQGGTDPTDATSRPPLIARIQSIGADDYFTISYLRFFGGNENGADYEHEWATYSTQGTLDLESGLWPDTPISTTPPADLSPAPDGYQWGCVRLPVSTDDSALGFMQLRVTPPTP